MFNTFDELKKFCKEKEIKMIDFKMIDLDGRWRHLTIPVGRFTEKTLKNGIGFDGSNYGFAAVEKSDMVFIPDITTSAYDTFVEVETLSMIGNVFVIGNPHTRFDQDPRNVCLKAETYMRKTGIADEIKIGPEFEFNIFDSVNYQAKPQSSSYTIDTVQAEWNSGNQGANQGYKVPHKGGYHITPPMDVTYDLRSEICMLLEERSVGVKYHHHEVGGPGQLEIEVEFGGLTEMADKTMIVKYVVKNAAFKQGKTATFMPKPLLDEAGNGMHVHMHMFKGGEPIFFDENGYSQLSDTALYFIGGLLKHAPALCGLTNPSTNSYKRLVPGYEAPVSICYATANRSAVIRIPDYARAPEDKRFEIRNPDCTCNPYFAYAAILMAGLDGIENKIDPVKEGFGPYDINLYHLTPKEQKKIKSLPTTLEQAMDALESDQEFLLKDGVFPKKLLEIWIKKKRAEAVAINKVPNPAEFAYYYDL
ncbi:MAG: type I glutamate--ammonia ligase [Anaerovorax sp.]